MRKEVDTRGNKRAGSNSEYVGLRAQVACGPQKVKSRREKHSATTGTAALYMIPGGQECLNRPKFADEEVVAILTCCRPNQHTSGPTFAPSKRCIAL